MDFLFSVMEKIRFCNRKEQTDRRRCQYYELEFYYGGTGASVVDGARYPHAVGNVLFARPGQERYTQGEMECFGIHFACLDGAFAKAYLDGLPTVLFAPDAEALFAELAVVDRGDALGITALLLRIIARLNDHPSVNDAPYAQEIRRVLAYLHEHYAEPIDTSALCAMSYLSHTAFFQAFRAITKTSPAAYLVALRLKHAKELLISTHLSVGEIALRCGFGSQSYFHAVFQKHLKQTPASYRRECRKRLL